MTPDDVFRIIPEVRPARRGWIAVSEEGSGLRIATVGVTETEARESFDAALREWAKLRSIPDRNDEYVS
jgi:hypothetical protein